MIDRFYSRCVEVFKEVFIMYNVSFGADTQMPVLNNYKKDTLSQQPKTNNLVQNSNSQMAKQPGTALVPVTNDTFQPQTPRPQQTQQRPSIYFPMMPQRQPQHRKFDWDNFYRIAGLAVSVVLTILIGLSLKPVIGGYFKKYSNDLWIDLGNVIDFDKLPGMKEAKQAFMNEVINPRKYRKLYEKENLDPNMFCILHGPPGTGKTNFVHSAAKKVGAKVAEFKIAREGESYMNATAKNIQLKADAIIEQARKDPDQEFFVLFDEVESILSEIKNPSSGADQDRQAVIKTFLQVMDSFKKLKNIKVFATTNMALDNTTGVIGNMNEAAMSRFGTKIFIDNPDKEAIEGALRLYLGKHPCAKDLLRNKNDISIIAEALLNSSYRDITKIIENAVNNKVMNLKIQAFDKKKNPDNIKLTKEIFIDAIRDFERTNKKLNLEAIEVPNPAQAAAGTVSQTAGEVIKEVGNIAETVKPKNDKLTPEVLEAIKKEIREILKRRKTTKKTNNAN